VPKVDARGQGGLLDVALDPKFADNALVYLSYSEPGEGDERGRNGTAVARGRLDGDRLADVQVVFRQKPKIASTSHFGSRLVFAPDGRLFVTLGERFSERNEAQNLGNHLGKVVRIESDGRAPADNPFAKTPGAAPEIWSYGHRNVQGAALHPASGQLWTSEHGPQGGDEVNVDEAGKNYGWPVITYGREYVTGAKIGEGEQKAGMEQPVTYWVPSIGPSGMAFLTGERYPGWQGSLFVGALRSQALVRLALDGRKVAREERLLTTFFERIRDVRQGPDGWLYLLTDNEDGRVVRLELK
jgi:aldose sugar dehydrogenase